jgi:hypothetical protein
MSELQNPYKTKPYGVLPDGTVDFTAYDDPRGVVESGKATQSEFDAARGNSPTSSEYGDVTKAGVSTLAKGGSATDAGANMLVASGNPYAMAAGLGLAAFSANQKQQKAYQEAQLEAQQATQQRMIQSSNTAIAAYDRMRNLIG